MDKIKIKIEFRELFAYYKLITKIQGESKLHVHLVKF